MYAKSETTITNILDAAEALFVGRSFASVSMQDIAEQAAVTKGALYHHFDSKEALYVRMMGRDLEAKRTLFAEALDVPGSARERLGDLTRRFFDLPPVKRRLIHLVRRDINFFDGEKRDRIVRDYQTALPDHIETIIREGIGTGEIVAADARLLAWSYVALVEVMLSQYAESVLAEREGMQTHVLDLFFSGAGAPTNHR